MSKMTLLVELEQQAEHFPMAVTTLGILEDRLNARGKDGWRLEQATQMIMRKGGSLFSLRSAYYNDDLMLVFERTNRRQYYRCRLLERKAEPEDDLAQINAALIEQNDKGFRLLQMVHFSSISDRSDRPTVGTAAHLLIFLRAGKLLLREVDDAMA